MVVVVGSVEVVVVVVVVVGIVESDVEGGSEVISAVGVAGVPGGSVSVESGLFVPISVKARGSEEAM